VAIKSGFVDIATILIQGGAKVSADLEREREKKVHELAKKNVEKPPAAILPVVVAKQQEALPADAVSDDDDDNSDRSENPTAQGSAAASAYSSKTITPRGSPRSSGRYIVSAEEVALRLQRLALEMNGLDE
jgi:hypothetical protein